MLLLLSQVRAGPAPAPEEPETFDYYISPTGSNSNDGLTTSTPWALSALSTKTEIAGKRIGLMDGTYVVSNTNFQTAGTATISYGGSSSAHTVVEAVNPRQAIITGYNGSSYVGEQAIFGTNGTSYVTIRGIRVTNACVKGIIVWEADNVLIEDCQIDDIHSSRLAGYGAGDNCEGVRIENSSSVTVRNCKMFDIKNPNHSANEAGVKTYETVDVVVEYCEFSDIACAIYDKLRGPIGTTFRYNYVHDCLGQGGAGQCITGFDDGASGTYKIHNNVIVSNGILYQIDNGDTGADCNLDIYNNTYIAQGAGDATAVWQALVKTASGTLKFYNNIIYRPSIDIGYRGDLNMMSASNATSDYNCYDAGAIKLTLGSGPSNSYTSLASWRTATSKDANSFQDDPEFANAESLAAAYKLGGSSPCLSAGRTGGTSGGSVVHIGAWDGSVTQIGCDF